MVIPPTENDGGIMQALAAPRRNNFSPLFTTFRHCLLVGEKAYWRGWGIIPPPAW
jgi:hypothetical protein